MKTFWNREDGDDTTGTSVGENESREPLFGDPVWVEERVRALQQRANVSSPAQATS